MLIGSRAKLIGTTAMLALLAGCSAGPGNALVDNALRSPQSDHAGPSGYAVSRGTLRGPLGVPPAVRASFWSRTTSARGFMSPAINAPGGASGFVSYFNNNDVGIYNTAGQLTGSLSGFSGPSGMAVDRSGNLYVADQYNARVQVYAKGYKGAPVTLNDPGQFVVDVAVDKAGNVAVGNDPLNNGPGVLRFTPLGRRTRPGLSRMLASRL